MSKTRTAHDAYRANRADILEKLDALRDALEILIDAYDIA